jgi:hypothetical protein
VLLGEEVEILVEGERLLFTVLGHVGKYRVACEVETAEKSVQLVCC